MNEILGAFNRWKQIENWIIRKRFKNTKKKIPKAYYVNNITYIEH